MYHPGKVLDVFNPKDKNIKCAEGTTQALIEMWDENMFTFLVAENIASKIHGRSLAPLFIFRIPRKSTTWESNSFMRWVFLN